MEEHLITDVIRSNTIFLSVLPLLETFVPPFTCFSYNIFCVVDIAAPFVLFPVEKTGSSWTGYLQTISAGFGGGCTGRCGLGEI